MIRETLRTIGRGVGVAVMTGVEVTALSVWLGLVGGVSPLSRAAAVGVAALAAGLLVAGLLAHLTANGTGQPIPALTLGALAVGETLLWVGWLAAVELSDGVAGLAGAGAALAVGLAIRHAIADNAHRGRDPLDSLVRRATAGFGALEAVGATAWLVVVSGVVSIPGWVLPVRIAGFSPSAIVGAALLACAVFVRHLLAVRHSLRPTRAATEAGWHSSQTPIRK